MLFPLDIIRVLRSIPDRNPMVRPMIPNRLEVAVPYVLVSSSRLTWYWDWPARPRVPSLSKTARLWDTAGSHCLPSSIISISSFGTPSANQAGDLLYARQYFENHSAKNCRL